MSDYIMGENHINFVTIKTPAKEETNLHVVGRKAAKGPELRQLSIKNNKHRLKNTYLHNATRYSTYEEWENHGYYSDQFTEPLQVLLWKRAEKQNAGLYWNLKDFSTYRKKQNRKAKISSPSNLSDTDLVDKLNNVCLYPLDIENDILDDFVVMYFGRRRSGKSFDERYIVYHLRHRYPICYVVTGTKLNNYWNQYVPKEFIYDIEDLDTFCDMLFDRQEWLQENQELLGVDPRVLLILDDVLADKYIVRFSKRLSLIVKNGRHYNIAIHITLQDVRGVPPDMRDNTDLAIFFRIMEGGRKKVVGEEWLSALDTEFHEEFLWNATGLLDPNTGESLVQNAKTRDKDRAGKPPKALAVMQARYTENLLETFKMVVGKDPGPFMLGKVEYYVASITGDYRPILQTDPRFRKKTRITSIEEVIREQGKQKKSNDK